jgi:D-beta-D-heptose 7-phosphate kinase/D-beta-D-heptose 1-phosphate adenosyltransferase
MNEPNTQQLKQFKILLIGDDCLDVYQFGTVDRISPEAPVPVFECKYEDTKPGMAGNVLRNLEILGCKVTYLHNETSTKTRLIDIRSKQQIVRIDSDSRCTPLTFDTVIPPGYDAVVVSDYNKGTVTYELLKELREGFTGPIFVDTKKTDLARLEGCIVKINQLEYSRITSQCTDLIVTQGDKGAVWNDIHFTTRRVEVADVCGAGDTFLAALTYRYLIDGNMAPAINFAICASAVTVQHIGNYAPNIEEIV